ncbi:MAG: PDR/VanB family oxidoreductase [Marmoricola sp.]
MVEQRELRVQQMRWESDGVISLRLSRIETSDPLPVWAPGAHIDVYVPDGTTRQYSLCGDPGDLSYYEIAVLREPESRGGSSYIHEQLRTGDRLMVTRPKQHFNLEDATHYSLIAGGIGITPIMTFGEHLAREGKSFSLTYGGRTADAMAYRARVGALGDAATFVAEDVDGRPDLAAIINSLPEGGLVYVCGPLPLLRAVEHAAEARFGPEQDVVRFELFSRAGIEIEETPVVDGETYELVLAKSGHTLRLKPDANILDVVSALGIEVENDCRDGICGSCTTRVLGGTIDHRDLVLTKREQAAMDQMLICCSRPTSSRLELDL